MGENEERKRRPAHRGSASVRRAGTHAPAGTGRGQRTVSSEERSSRGQRSQYGAHSSRSAYEQREEHRQRESRETHQQHSGQRKKQGKNRTGVLIAVAVVLIAAAIVAFLLFWKGKQGGSPALTETTEALREGAIRQNAVIDLSAILTDVPDAGQTESSEAESEAEQESEASAADMQAAGSARLSVQGMTPEEVKKAVAKRYSWELRVTNGKAEVGSKVKPTVDANETTEAATMGDAENPDSGTEDAEDPALQEITVSDSIEVPDLVAKRLDALLDEIVAADGVKANTASAGSDASAEGASGAAGSLGKAEDSNAAPAPEKESADEADDGSASDGSDAEVLYTLKLDGIEDDLQAVSQQAADMWNVTPKGGSIGSYDAESDSFKMEGAKNGFAVDEAALRSALQTAVEEKRFDAEVPVSGETLSADADTNLKDYQIIGTYTTKTTANSVRNKNIQLAAEKLNGTIIQPGEEFSFNNTVGERTAAKGYGAAAAYNEGEVVQEIGGGICQVSTTLYNAVLRSGLKTTKRQSHTFVPTYVTPGFDATVSWGGPDYRFANVPANEAYSNTGSYAIGIKAHYANRSVTVSIYGRPVLKDGYTYELSSKKVKDIDVVRKLIEPGSGKKPTKGTKGSQWTTNLVVKLDGKVISDKLDHKTYYSGHIEYYTEEPSSEAPTESSTAMPEGTVSETPAETETDANQPVEGPHGGPGVTAPEEGQGSNGTSNGPGEGSAAEDSAPGSAPGGNNGPGSPGSESSGTQAPAQSGNVPGGTSGNAPGSAPGTNSPISNVPPAL